MKYLLSYYLKNSEKLDMSCYSGPFYFHALEFYHLFSIYFHNGSLKCLNAVSSGFEQVVSRFSCKYITENACKWVNEG